MWRDGEDRASLDIFEVNEFRHLLHLRLHLKKASDLEGRRWLAKKYHSQKRAALEAINEKEILLERQHQD